MSTEHAEAIAAGGVARPGRASANGSQSATIQTALSSIVSVKSPGR